EWPQLRVVAQLSVPGDDSAERLAVRHYLGCRSTRSPRRWRSVTPPPGSWSRDAGQILRTVPTSATHGRTRTLGRVDPRTG
ncbi:MAG: hypothetical protein AAGG08_18825, partial [Actinomycetota bacterium]